MPSFTKEFEIRRILFGFDAILKCDQSLMPALVAERLPFITKHIAKLCHDCYKERIDSLEKNEKYIANGFESDALDE